MKARINEVFLSLCYIIYGELPPYDSNLRDFILHHSKKSKHENARKVSFINKTFHHLVLGLSFNLKGFGKYPFIS